jgi:hypothetical protein
MPNITATKHRDCDHMSQSRMKRARERAALFGGVMTSHSDLFSGLDER